MRNANDLYPTPPCAAFALRDFLDAHYPRELRQGVWRDRCAGFGTLVEWLGVGRPRRRALEYSTHPAIVEELRARYAAGAFEVGVDSLHRGLAASEPDEHLAENPPFSRAEEFVSLAEAVHFGGHGRTLACLLLPVGFWHAKRRIRIPDPAWQLALTWRPNFAAGYGEDGEYSGTFQDFVWSIYAPGHSGETRWLRLVRPTVPEELVQEHARLAHLAARMAA